jgi:hypothetical protein
VLAAVIGRVGLVTLPNDNLEQTEAEAIEKWSQHGKQNYTPTEAAQLDAAAKGEDKPKRTRRSKAQIIADEEAAAKAAAEPSPAAGDESSEAEHNAPQDPPTEPTPDSEDAAADPVTIEDLKSAASTLIMKDREAAKRILGELGVSKVSEISEEDYAKAVYLFTAAAA